ncbi:MAG: enoyl-CoA hydratase [Rhodospirillaceae bacterium]|nr:enoyl-CoA hydratase [Rhodospirillaceae bacterium]
MGTKNLKNQKRKQKSIKVIKRGGVCQIQFDRPKTLNSMNAEMAQEIADTLVDVELDRQIVAIVLCGNEKAFCAGADLSDMTISDHELFDSYRARFNHMPHRSLYRILCFYTKPVISAVEGYCLGGGFEIAMWGDIIIAGENAQFGLPEVRHSLIPGGGGTQNLPRLIGPQLAKELIWTGRLIKADEAKEYRIVNHVVPVGNTIKKAKEIINQMAHNGPLSIMMSKQAINRGLDQSRFNGFLGEGDLAHMLNFSEDRPEGLQAFSEKRKPNYKGQ